MKWFTFVFPVDVNGPNEGHNHRVFIYYHKAASFESARAIVNKKFCYPHIHAVFEGRLEPLSGEKWAPKNDARLTVRGTGSGVCLIPLQRTVEDQSLGWKKGPLANEQKNLKEKRKKPLAKPTAAP